MDYSKQFEDIPGLLGYFNQDYAYIFDWKDNLPAFEPLVRFFKTSNNTEKVKRMIEQVEKLLSLPLNDEELEAIMLEEIAVEYTADNYRQFLEESLEILKEPVEETRKHFIPEFIG